MKIELRKFKASKSLSEETLAFTADIWIECKLAGSVSNHGTGGPNMYHFADTVIERKFQEYIKSLPPMEPAVNAPEWERRMGPLPISDDILIGQLCDAIEREKFLARRAKAAVLFRVMGDNEDEFRTVKFKAGHRDEAVAFVRSKYGQDVVEIH